MPGRGPSIRRCRFTRLLALLAAAARRARGAGPGRRSTAKRRATTRCSPPRVTRSKRAASACRRAARCSCRPSACSGQASRTRTEVDSRDPAISPSFTRYPESGSYTLTLTQPLFRRQNWLQYEQAGFQVRQAEAIFAQAHQDLIVRVAQAYFDVLAAQDTLALVRAQKEAIAEQLAQAKRNFEVGTATITDTHEAQARFDLSGAQEIAAQNDLESKRRALQLLTGKETGELKPLRTDIKLPPPNPNDMETWVDLAEKQSYPVQIAEAGAESRRARSEAQQRRAPADARLLRHARPDRGERHDREPGRARHHADRDRPAARHAAVPGRRAHLARPRDARRSPCRSREDLENARRNAALAARQNYLAVINGIVQVGALEQALVSSQSALDSNKLGYEVGVRINIDVLNAQQQLFLTRRDLALARYNTITNHLRLKAAAGSLREEDLDEVNRALQ